MSDEKEDIIEKMKKMSVEELQKYESAAAFMNATMNVFGVMTILFALMFPYLTTVFVCTLLTGTFAYIGSGISEFLTFIRGQLKAKDK